MKKKTMFAYLRNAVLVVALYVVLSLLMSAGVIDRYYSGILTMMFINIIMAVSLNLTTGYLGQLVLGHAGFMSVGAFSAAIFTTTVDLPAAVSFPLALLIAGVVSAVVGIVIGIPALHLRGDYLAIITLGFGEIIRVIFLNLDITGGALGMRGIPNLTTFAWVFFAAVITIFIVTTFVKSRHGRAVIAIREDEIAVEASGINTTYYKMMAFVLAAAIAGVAGGLYAHHIGVINPTKFDFNYSIEFLVMVVLGGMGSTTGSILAAIVLTILPEALRGFSDYRMLLYSVVLIVMMLFKPNGLLGRYEFSLTRVIDRIRRKGKGGGEKTEAQPAKEEV